MLIRAFYMHLYLFERFTHLKITFEIWVCHIMYLSLSSICQPELQESMSKT